MKKKLASIMLVMLMTVIGLGATMQLTAEYASAMTRDAAVDWLRQQDGAWYDLDGHYGCQCSDFVSQYMRMISGTNYSVYMANNYHNIVKGDGRWTVINNYREFVPEPGDIFESTSTSTGHVGVVISSDANTALVAEANTRAGYGDGGTTVWVHNITWKSSGPYGATYYIRYNNFDSPAAATPRGSRMGSGYDRALPDGDYMIASAADANYYLDIIGGDRPAPQATNVNLWRTDNGKINDADAWTIKYANGFYRISQYGYDKSLDVDGGDTLQGKNIQVWSNNDSDAQQWAITPFVRNGKTLGYRIKSRCSGYSLDIDGGNLKEGTNVQQWGDNDSDAQAWIFIPYKPARTIEDGRYILVSALDSNLELDVAGDDSNPAEGTNVQVWHDNGDGFANQSLSKFNAFDVKYLGDGYYSLTQAVSGKALDQAGASKTSSANIQIWNKNSSFAQQWAITPQNNGYQIRTRCSGYAMDVAGGKTSDGTNVQQHQWNGSNAQTWKFVKAEYQVSYNVNGGKSAPSAQTKYYKGNLTLSSATPTRDGYTFKHWNTNADGNGTSYNAGATYTADNNATLYAQWVKTSSGSDPSNPVTETTPTTSGNTKDGYVYTDGVKYGKYMFVPASNYLYKVNLKKNKKKTFYKTSKKKFKIITNLSIHNKYVYFLNHTAQWEDPNNPSWLYRKKVNGKKAYKVCRAQYYKIVGNTVYAQYTVNTSDSADDSITYYTKCDLDGSNNQTISTHKGILISNYVNAKYKKFNAKKYKLVLKNPYPKPYKIWLKKPNGKKIYLGKHFNY